MALLVKRRRKKTGASRTAWRQAFAQAAKYCSTHKAPGERIQDCIRRVLSKK